MRWYPTKAEVVAAFERGSKRVGIAPPLHYPLSVSGDSIMKSNIAYLRSTWATEVREVTVGSTLRLATISWAERDRTAGAAKAREINELQVRYVVVRNGEEVEVAFEDLEDLTDEEREEIADRLEREAAEPD